MRLLLPIVAAALWMLISPPIGTSSVTPTDAVSTPAIEPATTQDDAQRRFAIESIMGRSGNLRALVGLPGSLAQDSTMEQVLSALPISTPGVHPLDLAALDGDPIVAIALEALPENGSRTATGYRIGRWPSSGLAAKNPRYARPAGFIPVTETTAATHVSERFKLQDFLTHDQQNVWPKALVLNMAMVDKLELIGEALEARGLPSRIHVMSGFRTPQYNEKGVGSKGGRASNSRHMYGDAADVFVDNDRNGTMDDINRDGRVTRKDAEVLFAVAEEVEVAHPELVGGLSAYNANSAHGPFVHVDTRGHKARW
jgi:hypothetical protein